jgi:hypothetical protein
MGIRGRTVCGFQHGEVVVEVGGLQELDPEPIAWLMLQV